MQNHRLLSELSFSHGTTTPVVLDSCLLDPSSPVPLWNKYQQERLTVAHFWMSEYYWADKIIYNSRMAKFQEGIGGIKVSRIRTDLYWNELMLHSVVGICI